MMAVSDYGQYEAALHLNLRDRYFPVVEVGYGKADHTEENTQMSYKTSAPFFRAGMDFNVLKNKHDIYRLYVGARYAFTSYKYDLASPGVADPVWGGVTPYEVKGAKCNYHWLEAALGVDVKLVGPLHPALQAEADSRRGAARQVMVCAGIRKDWHYGFRCSLQHLAGYIAWCIQRKAISDVDVRNEGIRRYIIKVYKV